MSANPSTVDMILTAVNSLGTIVVSIGLYFIKDAKDTLKSIQASQQEQAKQLEALRTQDAVTAESQKSHATKEDIHAILLALNETDRKVEQHRLELLYDIKEWGTETEHLKIAQEKYAEQLTEIRKSLHETATRITILERE